MMKKLSLELGGKNAGLVFADVDFEKAVEGTVRGAFLNQGEVCLALSRIYVQDVDGFYEKFVAKFVEETRKLKVGDPNAPDTYMGALNSKAHLEKVEAYANLAQMGGGTIHCGYGKKKLDLPSEMKEGYFFPPTVVTGLPNNHRYETCL